MHRYVRSGSVAQKSLSVWTLHYSCMDTCARLRHPVQDENLARVLKPAQYHTPICPKRRNADRPHAFAARGHPPRHQVRLAVRVGAREVHTPGGAVGGVGNLRTRGTRLPTTWLLDHRNKEKTEYSIRFSQGLVEVVSRNVAWEAGFAALAEAPAL